MKTLMVHFSDSQLDALIAVLLNAPYKDAAPFIEHLNMERRRLFNEQFDNRNSSISMS